MGELYNKQSARILLSITIGLFLASGLTSIKKPCVDEASGGIIERCVSFPDAIMYPYDLLNNEQSSLVRFSSTFVTTSLIGYVSLSIIYRRRNKNQTKVN